MFITFGASTEVEEVSGQKSEVRKLLRNDQLLIIRNGEVYNVQGIRVE